MGSNAINLLEEDLCCPVCKKPLSSPGAPPKTKFPKFGRGKGRPPYLQSTIQAYKDTRIAVGKFKDNEEIVVAQCGHLFHKFCLRHYCYLFREGNSNHICKVSCPLCQRRISMMKSLTVDYRSHQNKVLDSDKDYTKTSIMHNELSGQMETARHKLRRLLETIDDGCHNLELYRTHYVKTKKELKQVRHVWQEIDKINAGIEQSDRMITFMKNQHLKIVRKFISKMKEKRTKDFIHFPRRLAPLLQIIEEDDKLVSDLGEIIVPLHMNDLKSDRQSILKKLLTTANERLKEKVRMEAIHNQEFIQVNQFHPKNETQDQPPPGQKSEAPPQIFVQVQNSSISIVSSSTLTDESIQKIVKTVESPMQVIKKAPGKAPKEIIKLINKTSNNVVDKVSASDIKIIYMPKRRMIEQSSEPCRSVEEQDSFCVKIPSRRCKSADPVLLKVRKKPGQKTAAKGDPTFPLNRKRSKSVTDIPESLDNAPEKVIVVTQNVPTMTDSVTIKVPDQSAHDGSTEDVKQENVLENSPVTEEALETDDANHNTNPVQLRKEHATSPTPPLPHENVSILQMIYDNLEEERQSHCQFKRLYNVKRILQEQELGKNNNVLMTPHKPEDCLTSTLTLTPVPQLFRLDRKGMAYPESLYQTSLRQPTFLASFTPCETGSIGMTAFDQPDEENQLNALTAEERFLRTREREALLESTRNYCNGIWNSGRRTVFHGIPACLGMPSSQKQVLRASPRENLPFYMRKWQQRLPSCKVVSTSQRNERKNGDLGSSRIINVPKRHYKRSLERPQNLWCNQREREKPESILLPPLTMSPVKRPSTAVCEAIPTTTQQPYYPHEGPEQQLYFNVYNDFMHFGTLDVGV